MLISDVSVRRPVFAAVISLILVIVGGMSVGSMPIREFPAIERPIVSISTDYRGAASDIVERRVTQVLEDQLAGIAGITKISSVSYDERSRITLEFSRDRDIDGAANDVRDRVSSVLGILPDESEPPQISKQDAGADTSMWISVSSDTRSVMEVSDFADRYIVDALSAVDGVARIRNSGMRRPAMRIWIDTKRLAARELTVADVEEALRRENGEVQTAVGVVGNLGPQEPGFAPVVQRELYPGRIEDRRSTQFDLRVAGGTDPRLEIQLDVLSLQLPGV